MAKQTNPIDPSPVDAPADAPTKGSGSKKAPPSVVPTSELRAVTKEGPVEDASDVPVGSDLAGPSSADGLVAEHWHEPSNGPENTPAGAHRHTPDGPVHVHVVPDGVPVYDIRPKPWTDGDPDAPKADDYSKEFTADHDFTAATPDGQVIDYRKGQKVTGAVGKYLADTGAPVSGA